VFRRAIPYDTVSDNRLTQRITVSGEPREPAAR
jgi:hypothetical protein